MSGPRLRTRGNIVFAAGHGAFAAYALTGPFARRDVDRIRGATDAAITVLRLATPWPIERYVVGREAASDIRHAPRALLSAHLVAQRRGLERLAPSAARLYVSARVPTTPGPLADARVLRAEEELRERLDLRLACGAVPEAELRGILARGEALGAWSEPGGDPLSRWTPTSPVQQPVVCQTHGPPPDGGGDLVARVRLRPDAARPTLARLLWPLDELDFPVDAALTVAPDDGCAGTPRRPRWQTSGLLLVRAADGAELDRRVARLRRHVAAAGGDRWPVAVAARRQRPRLAAPPALPGVTAGACVGVMPFGTRVPVLFDLRRDASATGGAAVGATVVVTGAAEAGKTTCVKLLAYEAFLSGSLVVDVDPAGAHGLRRLPGAERHVEVRDLAAASPGTLDPLGNAPGPAGAELAAELLCALLQPALRIRCRAAIRIAAARVATSARPSTAAAVAELRRLGANGRAGAAALVARAAEPIGRLAIGEGCAAVDAGLALASLRMPDRLRAATTDPALRGAVQRLLVAHALRLADADPGRHALVAADDGDALVATRAGRALLREHARRRRASEVTLLLALRSVPTPGLIGPRVAATFCFRVATRGEAHRAGALLGLPRVDRESRRTLTALAPGHCLLRDQDGGVVPVRIDPLDDRLADALRGGGTRPRINGRDDERDRSALHHGDGER